MSLTEDQVRTIFAGPASGNSEKFFEHVDENVHWRVMGTHPLAGRYKSKKGFREATFARLGKLFPQDLRPYARDVLVIPPGSIIGAVRRLHRDPIKIAAR